MLVYLLPYVFDPDNIWCYVYALMQIWFKAMIHINKNKKALLSVIKVSFFPLVNRILLAIFKNFDFQTLQVKTYHSWRLFCFITGHWSITHVGNVCDQCISNKANKGDKLGITCKGGLSSVNY